MSSSLSRRSAKRRAEAIQKLIVFWVQQEWFTLPIQAAQKVTLMDQLYGAPNGEGLQLTHYQNQEILVIDIEHRIFGCSTPALTTRSVSFPAVDPDHQRPKASASSSLAPTSRAPVYLLIVQNQYGEPMGIPLTSQPLLRRVPISAFKPLPAAYLAEGSIRCVSAIVVPAEDEPPLFLLNLDQLLQTEMRSLPQAH
jgi:chemotaxis signal transduction protein